jgi:hypothetical protein
MGKNAFLNRSICRFTSIKFIPVHSIYKDLKHANRHDLLIRYCGIYSFNELCTKATWFSLI